jgi:hypothetical protein
MTKHNDKIQVESRNMVGMREEHNWDSVSLMMADWVSCCFPMNRFDEILFVKRGDDILYCSMGKKEKLCVGEMVSWFFV